MIDQKNWCYTVIHKYCDIWNNQVLKIKHSVLKK